MNDLTTEIEAIFYLPFTAKSCQYSLENDGFIVQCESETHPKTGASIVVFFLFSEDPDTPSEMDTAFDGYKVGLKTKGNTLQFVSSSTDFSEESLLFSGLIFSKEDAITPFMPVTSRLRLLIIADEDSVVTMLNNTAVRTVRAENKVAFRLH